MSTKLTALLNVMIVNFVDSSNVLDLNKSWSTLRIYQHLLIQEPFIDLDDDDDDDDDVFFFFGILLVLC